MAADQKTEWEERGTPVCSESIKLANQTLVKANEQEAAEMYLIILKRGRNKLVNIAERVHDEAEEECLIEHT